MLSKVFLIDNKSGLHVRPAGVLVKTVTPFKCNVTLRHNDRDFNAKSVLGIMGACIKQGHEITMIVDGEEEEACLKAIEEAIASGLGE